MDPVTALGLAAAVVQFVDFGSQILTKTSDIYRSGGLGHPDDGDLETVSKDMARLTERLNASLETSSSAKGAKLSTEEQEFQHLCQECNQIAYQLSGILASLNPPQAKRRQKSSKPRKWESFYQALRSVLAEEEIDHLRKRLDGFRQQLIIHILVLLRNQDDITVQRQSLMMEKLDKIDKTTRNFGTDFLERIDAPNRWQRGLVNRIYQEKLKSWDPNDSSAQDLVSERVQETDKFRVVSTEFLRHLSFPEIHYRPERIVHAYKTTFEWIYREPAEKTYTWANFAEWLRDGSKSSLYWITGKAGSGKSTLMKFLYYNPLTEEILRNWSSDIPLVTLAFFFWNSGSQMQMSQLGLLRTLLYHAFSKEPSLISRVCPKRWDVCRLFGNDPHPWTREDLLEAMKRLVQEGCKTHKLFFLIDGLDEFEGSYEDQQDLIMLLRGITTSPNVKMCVSSRPWPVFQDSFRDDPSLMLHHLTYADMQLYVKTKLDQHPGFAELQRRDSTLSPNIVNEIAQKSDGIWLWLYLVMRSLLETLTHGARPSDIRKIVNGLPTGLENLFGKMLGSLKPTLLEQASQIFQIFGASPKPPSLLLFSFADEEDTDFALRLECKPLSKSEQLARAESMSRRLNSLTKGLLEARSTLIDQTKEDVHRLMDEHVLIRPPQDNSDLTSTPEIQESLEPKDDLRNYLVTYLHRTVKDYFEKKDIWKELAAHTQQKFNGHTSLCRAFLIYLKTMEDDKITYDNFWEPIEYFMSHALWATEIGTASEEMVPLLDEFNRAANELANRPVPKYNRSLLQIYRLGSDTPMSSWVTLNPYERESTFLSLTVEYRLLRYVQAKLDQGCSVEQGPNCRSLLDAAMMSPKGTTDLNLFSGKPDLYLSPELFKVLLERGADPNRVDEEGLTPWKNLNNPNTQWQGPLKNLSEIKELFIAHGAGSTKKLGRRKRHWYLFGRKPS